MLGATMTPPAWPAAFLANLARTGNVAGSARLAGITSGAAYARRRTDGDFAAAWDEAIEDHTDLCEAELTRRAFGYEEPVVHQGQLSPVWETDQSGQPVLDHAGRPIQARHDDGSLRWLTVTKFSDTLLLARVKAYRRRYSTDSVVLTTKDVSTMTEAELDAEIAAASAALAKLPKAGAPAEAGLDTFA